MNELYSLYPHQQEAIDLIKESFDQGLTRPMLFASVAFGKTVVAAHIVSQALNDGLKVCFVVPANVLINQTAKSFENQGIPKAGIIQSNHPDTDPSKMLQIASVQTLTSRRPEGFDLYIVDEAHRSFKELKRIATETDIPMIGLSGSPYTKGLGKYYNNLITTKTMAQLIKDKFLSDYIAYAPSKPDMTGVKSTGGDFQVKETGLRASEAKLIGSVTETWLRLGENEPTITFACDVAHANFLGIAFDKIGVTNEVVTGDTPAEERDYIFNLFELGKVKMLINVGVLTTGYDGDVRCIIFARPTKSMMLWTQMAGRALRLAEGKDRAIMLDHAGNFERLGRPEDHEIDCLDDGKDNKNSSSKSEIEKKEKLPKVCPKCSILKDAGIHECPACGFKPVFNQDVETAAGELVRIKGEDKREKPKEFTDKKLFWGMLMGYKKDMRIAGKNYKDGWYAYKFKDQFGDWPNNLGYAEVKPSMFFINMLKSKQIAFAKGKK